MQHEVTERTVNLYILGCLHSDWRYYVEEVFDLDSQVQAWFVDRNALPDHLLNGEDGDFARECLKKLIAENPKFIAADRFKVRLREYLAPSLEPAFSMAAEAGSDLFTSRIYEWTDSVLGTLKVILDIQEPKSILLHEGKRYLRIYEIEWKATSRPVEFVGQDSQGRNLQIFSTKIDLGSGVRQWIDAEDFGRLIESDLPISVVVDDKNISGHGHDIERDN